MARTIREDGFADFLSHHATPYVKGRYLDPIIPFLFHNKEGWVTTTWEVNGKKHQIKWYCTDYTGYMAAKGSLKEMTVEYGKLDVDGKTVVDCVMLSSCMFIVMALPFCGVITAVRLSGT